MNEQSPPMALFTYGTLMLGQSHHHLITKHAPTAIHDDSIPGQLFVVDWYPGFVPSGETSVKGERIHFEDLESIVAELDEYEGDEYERVILTTDAGILCWVYVYTAKADHFPRIVSGDWRDS